LDSGQCLATVPLLDTNMYQAVLNAVVGTLDRIREGIESLKVLKTTRRHTGKQKSTDGTINGIKKRVEVLRHTQACDGISNPVGFVASAKGKSKIAADQQLKW